MPGTGWKKLSPEEQRLAIKWYWEQGKAPSEIAGLLDRDNLNYRLSPEIRLPAGPAGEAGQRRTAVGRPLSTRRLKIVTFTLRF